MGEILLIASDWQFRALVRAQLLEEGYAVRALPSPQIALAYLVEGGDRPRLTVLDVQGIEIDRALLTDLWRLTGEAPLVLCGGMLDRAALTQAGLPAAAVMMRPFFLGSLVEEVRKVLSCPSDRPEAE